MAPAMGLKRSAAAAGAGAAAAAQTVTLSAPAVRDAVRAAVREAEATAAKATAPPASRVPATATAEIARDGVLCLEEVDGRRWSYVVDAAGAAVKAKGRASVGLAFKAVPLQSPLPPVEVRPPPPAALDRRISDTVGDGLLFFLSNCFVCLYGWCGLTRR
jgi:hypothetical protein